MNCKPNELAVVVRTSPFVGELLGRICTTLHLAPSEPFKLPDSYESHGCNHAEPAWVVEFANAFKAPIGANGVVTGWRQTRFGVVSDSALRPIRGAEDPEDPEATGTQAAQPLQAIA